MKKRWSIIILLIIAFLIPAAYFALSSPREDVRDQDLSEIVSIYHKKRGGDEGVPSDASDPFWKYDVWKRNYQHTKNQYKNLLSSRKGKMSRYSERSAEHLVHLCDMMIKSTDAILKIRPELNSTEYDELYFDFLALHVAIGDRISLIEVKTGRDISPK